MHAQRGESRNNSIAFQSTRAWPATTTAVIAPEVPLRNLRRIALALYATTARMHADRYFRVYRAYCLG